MAAQGLCSPRTSFCWDQAKQASFDVLKAALTSAPVLRVWESAQPTQLNTDTSKLAIGAILEQPVTGTLWPLNLARTPCHHQERWLDAIAEFKVKVMHTMGSTKPADFIT